MKKKQDKKQLFLIGPPRSGTTILTQVLNTSKYILLTDELRVNAWLIREMQKINDGHEVHGDPYPFNKGSRFALYLQRKSNAFIEQFYNKLAQEEQKEEFIYWGDKYPHYDRYLKKFPRLFPDSLYIGIFRNISEVINSVMVGHKWEFKKSMDYCKRIYKSYIDQLVFLDEKAVFIFDYSQLKAEDPLEEISRMFTFLNIEIEENQKNIIKSTLSYQSHSTRKADNVGKKFSANKSRYILTSKELEVIESDSEINIINSFMEEKYSLSII